MKKPTIVILIFLLVLGGISASTVLSYWDKETVSERENRNLSAMPEFTKETWLTGEFAADTEAFLGDHAYNRDRLLDISDNLEARIEREMEVKVVSQAVDLGQGGQENAEEKPDDPSAGEEKQQNEGESGEEEERLILDDRVLSTYTTNEKALSSYKNAVNSFMDMFPDTIIKANLIVPSRIAFEQDYQDYTSDQRSDIQNVYKKLRDEIYTVDIWDKLAKENVNDIYFRTDHHWTADGAYIGVKGYLEAIGRECVPKEVYEQRTGEPYLGYLYAQTGEKKLEAHRDELVYYVHPDGIGSEIVYKKDKENPDNLISEQTGVLDADRQGYYTFVESSFSHAIITGKAEDGSCLLLVGDSYCNAMAPWLSDNFGKVIIIDPRYWISEKKDLMELCEKEGVTDVLVTDYASVISNSWFTSKLRNMTK